MDRLKSHEDEQAFFARELRARRELLPHRSTARILNILYGATSNYGQSVERPLLWLIVLFVIGFAIFAEAPVFNKAPNINIPPMNLAPMKPDKAVGLSFANIFSFLPVKRELMTADFAARLPGAAQVVGVVQFSASFCSSWSFSRCAIGSA